MEPLPDPVDDPLLTTFTELHALPRPRRQKIRKDLRAIYAAIFRETFIEENTKNLQELQTFVVKKEEPIKEGINQLCIVVSVVGVLDILTHIPFA